MRAMDPLRSLPMVACRTSRHRATARSLARKELRWRCDRPKGGGTLGQCLLRGAPDVSDATGRRRAGLHSEAAVLRFIEQHGVVLVAARGPVPRLTEAIVGEPVAGSWWSHPEGKRIYRLLNAAVDSDDVLRCRVVDGKVTLVHRRLWPALVAAASHFEREALARVDDVHTDAGHHERIETPFPAWVPPDVAHAASGRSELEAIAELGGWAEAPSWPADARRRRRRSPEPRG